MFFNIMAQTAFTILNVSQVEALQNVLSDETEKQAFLTAYKKAIADAAKRESSNRMGGRKPSELYFVGYAPNMIFDRDADGKPIIPQTEEDWNKVRVTYVYQYSTKKDGKACGHFFAGQLFKVGLNADGEELSGLGDVNVALQEWENSVERLGQTNEQAAKATLAKLQSFGKISCQTVVLGKNRGGGDLFGYNLNKAE